PYGTEAVTLRLVNDLSRNTDRRADRLVQSLEPRSGVQHIAECGIFQPGTGTDIADYGNAGMDPDTGVAEMDTPRLLLDAEAAGTPVDRQCGADRPVGMVRLVDRRAEKCQHRIADKLVHHAALGEDRRAYPIEIIIADCREEFRLDALGEGRETG